MRLIDADALIKIALKNEDHTVDGYDIMDAPTVDAVPVVHGHWIENEDFYNDSYYTCSACGRDWTTIDGTPEQNNMKYCPECGAKMDGKRRGE